MSSHIFLYCSVKRCPKEKRIFPLCSPWKKEEIASGYYVMKYLLKLQNINSVCPVNIVTSENNLTGVHG